MCPSRDIDKLLVFLIIENADGREDRLCDPADDRLRRESCGAGAVMAVEAFSRERKH